MKRAAIMAKVYGVAPFTGAWIEMQKQICRRQSSAEVAPFTGAWIEITLDSMDRSASPVAPFTGAWIEIQSD